MNPIFNSIRLKKPGYNTFDLSHEKKLSCQMGDLIPIFLSEVIPGDKFRVSSEMMVRLAPMVFPIMHRINVFTHFFFVPNRLVWDNWETFITGGSDGLQTPTFPVLGISDGVKQYADVGSLTDYFGLPPAPQGGVGTSLVVNSLPYRAYQMIYNEFYRDQNLQAEIAFSRTDGLDTGDNIRLMTLRKRCWEKDYFTAALPWAQRGGDVTMPFTGDLDTTDLEIQTTAGGAPTDGTLKVASSLLKNASDQELKLVADASVTNGTTTINELRRALKLQQWLERNARGGARYIEQIFAHFGIKTSDARLQRPEYLGGGKSPIVISEVLNTSDTATSAQGAMAGHGIGIGNTHRFTKGFEEHGFIIGIMSILPRTAYQQGVPKMFSKIDKFDYFWPEFAHLGEQAVQEKEVYFDYTAANTGTFGYQPRYSEYKFNNSSVHGDFRDSFSDWHMGRIFASKPALNAAFVESDPTHRIFAVETASVDKCYVQIYNDVRAIRPMPVFGTPLL